MRIAALLALATAITLGGCNALPPSQDTSSAPVQSSPGKAVVLNSEARQCLAQLGDAGARFYPKPDKLNAGGCSISNTVRLDALGGDQRQFEVTNLPTVGCPVANSFADWARFGVDRAARQILGSGLQRIETMGSYACRNVAGTGRLSAHSRAQAVDVSGFVLADGRRITVKDGWNASRQEREFLQTIHRSACKRFGTVLGPEYNAAHRDHLHLELGSGSFCR
ncbi:extensin family protein [Qipengyuania psychrotolerans]|uniref:Extensin family protein n=1 Tax=Qipengyuania psychrotolerans TaxID=2867238 RepID=A0ABX8ZBH4_9SPHN|nr:extensin family protein [Qipengyuania psychrotolerans]QZD86336.1 extensin family protein [Qipengyuania psychrotolerans]